MVDATAEDVEDAAGEDAAKAPPPRKWWSGKRLTLYVVLPLLLIGLAGGGAHYFGLLDQAAKAIEKATTPPPAPVVFHDLPEILINLNTGGRQASYLKLRVSLELNDPEAIPRLELLMPRIVDNFQTYLRELRPDDLTGSAGLYRLKEELLFRVNEAVQPIRIKDVLFKEMLVQ